jgi:ATP-binding cassette subfamily B protein RaxB
MAYIYDEIMQFPMQFHTFVGDLQNSISGGQKQRICLARAFYQTPKVLGIDEGTSHLDPRAESAVTRTMSGLGITRITVAHRIETLRTADRILLIEDGKLRPVSLDEIKEIGNGRASRDRAFAGGG